MIRTRDDDRWTINDTKWKSTLTWETTTLTTLKEKTMTSKTTTTDQRTELINPKSGTRKSTSTLRNDTKRQKQKAYWSTSIYLKSTRKSFLKNYKSHFGRVWHCLVIRRDISFLFLSFRSPCYCLYLDNEDIK